MNGLDRRALLGATAAAAAAPIAAQVAAPAVPALEFREVAAPDGVPLNLVTTGRGARGVLFLHGFSQSYLSFMPQLSDPLLTGALRLAALDLRGHGASGKPWEPAAYLDSRRWAQDIDAAIAAAALDRPLLVAWSFGGYCALDYVRHYGTRAIAGIVFVGSNGGLLPRPPAPAQGPDNDLAKQLVAAERFMTVMTAHPAPADASARGRAAYLMCPPYVRRAMTGRNLDNADLAGALKGKLDVILGDRDPLAAPGPLAQLRARVPGARIALYPDTGHSPFVEAPARFNRDIAAIARAAR